MAPRVRAAEPADLDAIEAIETSVFASDQLSRRSLRRFLQVPTTASLVAEWEGRIAGYAMIGFRKGSATGRIFTLAVAREAARCGVGSALLKGCEAAALARGAARAALEVRADNAAAVALYRRAGYADFGRHDDYYEDGTAAIRFDKALMAST